MKYLMFTMLFIPSDCMAIASISSVGKDDVFSMPSKSEDSLDDIYQTYIPVFFDLFSSFFEKMKDMSLDEFQQYTCNLFNFRFKSRLERRFS
ncbi:MAG: hypothetical protein LBB29_00280 [Holosporaceae bacterium]|jgi:hypothetical protein|nr:hypothetical protein [Holosporaceae bacterium]